MFADSLLEFGTQNKRKALATTSSFVFNCLLILVMLAVPLMFTEELPKAQLLTFLNGASASASSTSAGSGRWCEW